MSGRLVHEVLEHAPADLTDTELLVLLSLAEDAHEKTRSARHACSVDDIARRTRRSPGAVRNTLSRLVDRGLIIRLVKKHEIHRGGKHQEYELARLTSHHRFATIRDTAPKETR